MFFTILANSKEKVLLIGLHTCGDLAPIILRNFVSNPDAQVLVNVGCCYHKLNNGEDKPFRDIYGFMNFDKESRIDGNKVLKQIIKSLKSKNFRVSTKQQICKIKTILCK